MLLGVIIISAPRPSRGQGGDNPKDVNVANTPNVNVANTPNVNAQQSGAWNVGPDRANNIVRLGNTPSDPLPVAVVNSAGGGRIKRWSK